MLLNRFMSCLSRNTTVSTPTRAAWGMSLSACSPSKCLLMQSDSWRATSLPLPSREVSLLLLLLWEERGPEQEEEEAREGFEVEAGDLEFSARSKMIRGKSLSAISDCSEATSAKAAKNGSEPSTSSGRGKGAGPGRVRSRCDALLSPTEADECSCIASSERLLAFLPRLPTEAEAEAAAAAEAEAAPLVMIALSTASL